MSEIEKHVERAEEFAARLGIRVPILLAPMAGACPPSLSIAVANAGGMGACGALLMKPAEIAGWCADFRGQSQGEFQINLWIPGPAPKRDLEMERRQREYLAQWGPPVSESAAEGVLPDFDSQCQSLLDARPKAISSIMGLYEPQFVAEMKRRDILWFATATTVAEARAAEAAGADAVIAQGMEAGGHRGAFDANEAQRRMVGLFALLPQVVDAVSIPVIAAGGVADGRGVAAALILGASAAMIGTGFLRCPEAKINPAWADALSKTEADETMITRAFTGRPGRGIANDFARASATPDAPPPAPYPLQRGLSIAARTDARDAGRCWEIRQDRSDADVGGAERKTRPLRTCRRSDPRSLGGSKKAFLIVIEITPCRLSQPPFPGPGKYFARHGEDVTFKRKLLELPAHEDQD